MAQINPFQGPINYATDVQSPFEAALGGMKVGAALADVQARRQAQEQAQAAQTEVANLFKNPNATATDYARVATLLPKDQAEGVRKSFEMLNAEQQQNRLSQSGQVYAAMQSGQPEIAKSLLQQQGEAFTASGRPEQAKAIDTYIKLIDLNPTGAKVNVGLMIAELPGGTKLLENIDKVMAASRAEAKAPLELKELEAKALQEGVKAEFARPVAVAELAKTKAETLAPSVRESIDFANLQPEQQRTFQALQILKKPPAAVTNVSVQNIDKSAAAELGKLVPDLYNQANSAATQIDDLPRYKAALDSAITGPFAEQRLSTTRVANALGFTGDKAVNATREVIQGLSEMALKSRTMLTGQGQITEGEQKLLVKARSGDINFTKGELKTIFDVADRAANAQYNQSRKLLESAAKQSPTAQMFLENMQPLVKQEVPKPAPAPAAVPSVAAPAAAAPGMPAGFRVIQRGQ